MTKQALVVAKFETLEENRKLSESLIWKLQEDLYIKQGVNLWRKRPVFVTGSAAFCEIYANLVVQFFHDQLDKLDLDKPFYIVELGSGSGAFGFRFLKFLTEKMKAFSALKEIKVRYVMTDFIDEIIPAWRKNERLKPFIDEGILDFSIFRPEHESTIKLAISGEELPQRKSKNPILFIANAFFDTIRQDAFRVNAGRLEETTFSVVRYEDFAKQSLRLEQLELIESYKDAHELLETYYDEPDLNAVLHSYVQEFENASIIFPIGALRALTNLREMTKGNFAVLSAAKGFSDARLLDGLFVQKYLDLSFGLNFDAIKRYFAEIGGETLLDSRHNHGFRIMFNWQFAAPAPMERTRFEFENTLIGRDQFAALLPIETCLAQAPGFNLAPGKTMEFFLCLLRTFNYDPAIFSLCIFRMYDTVERELENATQCEKQDMLEAVMRVEDNIYALDNLPAFEESDDALQMLVRVWKRVQMAHSTQPGRWLTVV